LRFLRAGGLGGRRRLRAAAVAFFTSTMSLKAVWRNPRNDKAPT
jgi:hypothetical protein